MIQAHLEDPTALLARYRYRTAYGIAGAEEDLALARSVAPGNPDVLLAAAIAAAENDRESAKTCGERLLEVAPDDRRGYLALAGFHARWNEPRESVAVLKRGLDRLGKDDLDLNRMLLRMVLSLGDTGAARTVLDSLTSEFRRVSPFLQTPVRRRFDEELQVAEAQLLVLKGKPEAALPALKRMAAAVTEGSDADETLAERERRFRILSAAYSRSGLHDLAAAAGDELVLLNPRSKEYRLLTAAEWRASGNVERAERNYEAATLGEPETPAAWLGLAEIRLERQIRRPVSETRDWTDVDAALKRAQALLGDAPALLAMQATAALARNDRQTALVQLKKLMSNADVDPDLLPRVAGLLDAAGDAAGADAAVDRIRNSGGDSSQATLVQADLLRRRGQSPAAIRLLEEASEQASDDRRGPILRRLIDLEADGGAMRSARRRLHELRKAKTTDPWYYETAAELALMAGDAADLHACEAELESLEGSNGTRWRYYRAVRLLEEKRSSEQQDLREAGRLLSEIETLRPKWPQSFLLRGRIAERLGRLAEATDEYELALRSGARSLTTFQWLVSTLYRQNRFADAAAYIGQGGALAAASGDLSSLAVPASLRAGRLEDALRVARAAAELRPGDVLAQVWHAQTMALAGRADEAENAFRKAIELAPKDIRAWSGLVWFYSRARRQPEARQTLEELVAKVEMAPLERQLVLARGFDLIGDRALAEKHFRAASKEHPNDVRRLEEIGRFQFRFDYVKALETFRAALEIDPKSVEARRAVAALMGLIGSEAEWGRAVEMLNDNRAPDPSDDRRLQATLLVLRGGADSFQKAAEIISESIAAQEKPNPIDRLLLARTYEELGRIDPAMEQITSVVESSGAPASLALGIEFAVRHDRFEAAERWLASLEAVESAATRALDLRVGLLERSGRSAEIEPLVERFVTRRLESTKLENQKAALHKFAADLLTRAKLFSAAESQLREMVKQLPAAYEALAIWLADRGRIDEAVAICREPASDSEAAARMTALVRVLTIAAGRSIPPAGNPDEIEKMVSAAGQSPDASVPLLLELGVLRIMQSRDAEAISLYERALRIDPESIAVLNNLALALAEVPERHAQALVSIDRAVAGAPNSAELLDSKALVLIGIGRDREAHEILVRLCQINRKSARYRLHLAMALDGLNEQAEARRNLSQALDDGLSNELLTPSERRLQARIAPPEAPADRN
jgi:tetratricopeptide (TPR) repeat protein